VGDALRVEVVDEGRTRELRRAVLRPNLPPDAPLPGDELTGGVHLAALDEAGAVLGTCLVYLDPCPWLPERDSAWHLRQMATTDGRRGQGIGGTVAEAAIGYATAQGGRLLWCNAREAAVPFYRRHGFVTHGDVYLDEHTAIAHQHMWRELSG
jgi:GNAT superfamily N-acetyltransferase